jgi:hypothetical protein
MSRDRTSHFASRVSALRAFSTAKTRNGGALNAERVHVGRTARLTALHHDTHASLGDIDGTCRLLNTF